MNIILFDDANRNHLLPLTFTRPVAELRVGILSLKEKWQKRLEGHYSYLTEEYLSGKFPIKLSNNNYFVNGGLCANDELAEQIKLLKPGEALRQGDVLLATRLENEPFHPENTLKKAREVNISLNHISRPYHVFLKNAAELEADFDLLTAGRTSAPISSTNTVLGDRIFAEKGAVAECATFNTHTGPVYLGENSTVMEGSMVRGGLALCQNATLKMAAKIYGATTVGPHCKVGGEVNNSVFIAYSNKGHDGFLGNAVIGEWCNIGADTNNSNLKNNYDEVKIWSYVKNSFVKTGQQFCGLFMGDHSKCGINTMFNTGTVIGVSANIFGSGFPRVFIPSFSWGGAAGFSEYKISKAFEAAQRMMERRNIELDKTERDILQYLFDKTAAYR